MLDSDDLDLDGLVTELVEIGVGATILALRQLNISRRELVASVPALEPVVDSALEGIDALAPEIANTVSGLVEACGGLVPGATGEAIRSMGAQIADLGPELLRLSGLTRRG